MLNDVKKKLYFARRNVLFTKASESGKIQTFEEEIFERMSTTIIACLPVSLYIKYAKYLLGKGTCYDRSLYMFLALDDAILVRGDQKDLEYNYGKENSGHGWIEIGDYVYDPSTMLKYDKKIYYALYGSKNVFKIDKQTYLEKHKDFVDAYVTHNFDEFRQGGKRRLELGIFIETVKSLAELIGDRAFIEDLNIYLSLIQYDEEQIQEEIQEMKRNII